jgi:hypothetical protein
MQNPLAIRTALVLAMLGGTSAAFAAPPELVSAAEQLIQTQAAGATRNGNLVEGSTPKTDWSVALEGGRCYYFAGAATAAKRLSLFLWGPDGHRVADAKPHAETVLLTYCPLTAGLFHVQAKMEGKGTYVVATYTKQTRTAPPPLVNGPQAQAPAYPATQPPAYPASQYPPPPRPLNAPPTQYAPPAPAYPVYPGYAAGVTVGGVTVGVGVNPGYGQECRMGADGINVCGYNCQIGANGHMYCSGVPGGHCALNADGTFTCPTAVYGAPVYGAPVYGAPVYGAPVYGNPYGGPTWQSNKGMRNDPCHSSIDCGFGLFCREDSDGYKMCM